MLHKHLPLMRPVTLDPTNWVVIMLGMLALILLLAESAG